MTTIADIDQQQKRLAALHRRLEDYLGTGRNRTTLRPAGATAPVPPARLLVPGAGGSWTTPAMAGATATAVRTAHHGLQSVLDAFREIA